jgi:ATP-binding cassette subfamily C protein LapB
VRKEIARAKIAWNEIESFLEQKQVARKVQIKDVTGRLECRDLTYVYPEATNPVFERLSFMLEPGTSLAVVGANGTGKSTFLRLMAGLIVPGRGYVFVDGQNLAQMDNKWWQEQIIYLPQEPGFLPLSMRENILLGREVEDDDLQKAIDLAGLANFLVYSPQGLETILLDGGLNLPVGIRKRIALARAILKPGKIVIMDEPTASLDMQGRKAVYNLLNLFHKQGSTIILATDDPAILKGSAAFLDLNYKPVPKIKTNQRMLSSGVIQ